MRTAICWSVGENTRPRVHCIRAVPETIFVDLPGQACVQLDDEAAAALYEALGQTLQDRQRAREEMTARALADGEARILSGPPDVDSDGILSISEERSPLTRDPLDIGG